MDRDILEKQHSVPVYDECDVLVVGGGAAGHSAAIAAARAGCSNVVLLERYGYMGGDVTGGYVLMVPKLSWRNLQFVRGLQEEWFVRMASIQNAVYGPDMQIVGTTNPEIIKEWAGVNGCIDRAGTGRLIRAVQFEPNQLKIELDKMLKEESNAIRVYCHCWACVPIMEDNSVKGVIFESKEGRRAILAKTVIDATGDGDIFRRSGAPFFTIADGRTRSSTSALVWRIGGIDWKAYTKWQQEDSERSGNFRRGLSKIAGFRSGLMTASQNDMCWVNNWHSDMDCSNIKDATKTEMETRDTIREVIEYLKRRCPEGFKNAFLYDIAPQLGCRASCRLDGEYLMSADDFAFAKKHDDVIAWHSTICRINEGAPVEIPFRAILPKKVENLLAPGRHLSADAIAIDWLNLIPQCVGTGQAAGVAAAVAAADGVKVRDVDIKKVQEILIDQDVPLPRNSRVDKAYTDLCIEYEYGLQTEMAKRIAAGENILDGYKF